MDIHIHILIFFSIIVGVMIWTLLWLVIFDKLSEDFKLDHPYFIVGAGGPIIWMVAYMVIKTGRRIRQRK